MYGFSAQFETEETQFDEITEENKYYENYQKNAGEKQKVAKKLGDFLLYHKIETDALKKRFIEEAVVFENFRNLNVAYLAATFILLHYFSNNELSPIIFDTENNRDVMGVYKILMKNLEKSKFENILEVKEEILIYATMIINERKKGYSIVDDGYISE